MPPFWELLHERWDLIIPNVLLFVPFGLFAGRLWGWKAILLGLFLSVCIETVQFIFALGFSEVDDVINNTIGTAVGAGLVKVICQKQ